MHSAAKALQAGNLAKAVGTGFLGDGREAAALASANGSALAFGNEPRVRVDECSTCSCTAPSGEMNMASRGFS